MKFVIAEKTAVAKSLAAVLGADEKRDGYLEGNGYIVSWCVGHLLELAEPQAYDERYAKWRYEDLPILPGTWKYDVPKDKKKQLSVLCRLMRDKRVDSIVCATDAGREGELIFRLVYEYADCRKPVERLWISSMEDSAIRDGFAHLRPGNDYARLYQAALCRAGADWLIGINATRLFSVLYGATLNVGRVLSPTLNLLVKREAEIDAFKSTPYYVPEIDCGGFTVSGEKLPEKAEAERIKADCDGRDATVESIEKQTKTVQPPRLYDLTTLQRDCNRIFGFTAQQTLNYLQSLYEKKLATYPRTDSRYLTEDMKPTAASLIEWLRENMPFGKGQTEAPDVDRVTDNRKVTDHHAILPTMEIAKTDFPSLPVGEQSVLTLLCVRLLCATGQVHRFETVTVTLDCAGHAFSAKGKTVLRDGWKETERLCRTSLKASEADDNDGEETALPELSEGQCFSHITATVREGKTVPPKRYTEDTLLSAMETAGADCRAPAKSQDFVGKGGAAKRGSFSPQGGNDRCGACDDAPEDAERKGLGTPATRAAILEKLVSAGFAIRQKKQLLPTEKGVHLIAVLPEKVKSPRLTAEWESKLKQVERGELEADTFLSGIRDLCRTLIREHKAPEERFRSLFPRSGGKQEESIGTCPRCGGNVYEREKGFFCENRACSFALWKENLFFKSKKKSITKPIAALLLKEGRAFVSGLYSEKTGKTYDAVVVLDDPGGKYVNFKLEFEKGKGKKGDGRNEH